MLDNENGLFLDERDLPAHLNVDFATGPDSIIKEKELTEIEVWRVVLEWYTNGMYPDELNDHNDAELEGICEIRLGELGYYDRGEDEVF